MDRLLRAGAILFARTTTPEFALLGVTHSDLWGVTRNPWNLDFSPGGSSGGAGAALAAGMTTLADGSDIGGSIRIPASCCGVFGLKPSHGRVPSGGPGSLDSYLAYGPMTRTVADAALMLNVMAGQHHDDPASVPDELALPLHPEGIKGWRIALSMDLGYFEVDPEVVRNTESAAAALREAGAIVEEVRMPVDPPRVRGRCHALRGLPGIPGPETMPPEDRDFSPLRPGSIRRTCGQCPGSGLRMPRPCGTPCTGTWPCLRTVSRPHHAHHRGAFGLRRPSD